MIQEKTSPKREEQRQVGFQREVEEQGEPEVLQQEEEVGGQEGAVSYTHLTLPTSDLV